MATVSDIDIVFNFSNGEGDSRHHDESFDPADSSLKSMIEERRDDLLTDLNEDCEDEWVFDDYDIDCFDDEWADPADFSDLDEYGVYAENIEEFGEAFHLRYEDLGETTKTDFQDSYNGCWGSAEEFVQNMLEDSGDMNVPSYVTIDWERTTRDIMMDYTEYDGDKGTHIFRD